MTDVRLLSNYEIFDYSAEMIKESKDKFGGKIIMKGILQKADTLNQNGRIYPMNVLEREVRNYQKFIIENRAMGELDHPDTSVVNLKNVSHVVREAHIEDGTVFGSVEILNTPYQTEQTFHSFNRTIEELKFSAPLTDKKRFGLLIAPLRN